MLKYISLSSEYLLCLSAPLRLFSLTEQLKPFSRPKAGHLQYVWNDYVVTPLNDSALLKCKQLLLNCWTYG